MSTVFRSDPRPADLSLAAAATSIALATLTSACGSSEGDCIDALQFQCRTYTDVRDVAGYSGLTELDSADLDELAMVVSRENCGGVLENGEATTLDAGTPVYLVPSNLNLLAARSGATYLLFIADNEEP